MVCKGIMTICLGGTKNTKLCKHNDKKNQDIFRIWLSRKHTKAVHNAKLTSGYVDLNSLYVFNVAPDQAGLIKNLFVLIILQLCCDLAHPAFAYDDPDPRWKSRQAKQTWIPAAHWAWASGKMTVSWDFCKWGVRLGWANYVLLYLTFSYS